MGSSASSLSDSGKSRFSDKELSVLKKTYDNLLQRSDSGVVDKQTFLKMFSLPGMMGERLFAGFDTSNSGKLTYDDFLQGLSQISRGTLDEKVKFVFRMYDISGTGSVSRDELSTMLNSAVFGASSVFNGLMSPSASKSVTLSSPDTDDNPVESIELRHRRRGIVRDLVNAAFEHKSSHEEQRMGLQEFRDWILNNPESLLLVESVFIGHDGTGNVEDTENVPFVLGPGSFAGINPDTNSRATGMSVSGSGAAATGSQSPTRMRSLSGSFGRKNSNSIRLASQPGYVSNENDCRRCGMNTSMLFCYECGHILDTFNHCIKCNKTFGRVSFCMNCGFNLAYNDQPLEPSKLRGSAYRSETIEEDSICQGYLYKKISGITRFAASTRKRWFVLRDKFLYYFRSMEDHKPAGVIYMDGCFVDITPDTEPGLFGIEIVMSGKTNRSQVYYAKTEKDRNRWLAELQRAANVYEFQDFYSVLDKKLGSGKFSQVFECEHKATKKKYAVKIINKKSLDDTERESLRTEIAILQLVNHQCIILLKNVFEHRDKLYLVLGLASGGDLFERLSKRKRYNELNARKTIQNILLAVQYLHEMGIIHRDLKPENIMLSSIESDYDILLTDFGLSVFAGPKEKLTFACGTMGYCAPEVLENKGYDKSVDLWSIGVITYVLLRGRMPFTGEKKAEIKAKSIEGKLDFNVDPFWQNVSEQAKSLISGLVNTDPKKRLGVEDALMHPWFTCDLPQGDEASQGSAKRKSISRTRVVTST